MTLVELLGGALLVVVGGLAVATPERMTVLGERLFSAGTSDGAPTATNVRVTRVAGAGLVAFGCYYAF